MLQAVQTVDATAPVAAEKRPARHKVQLGDPELGINEPPAHGAHMALPVAAEVPAEH